MDEFIIKLHEQLMIWMIRKLIDQLQFINRHEITHSPLTQLVNILYISLKILYTHVLGQTYIF